MPTSIEPSSDVFRLVIDPRWADPEDVGMLGWSEVSLERGLSVGADNTFTAFSAVIDARRRQVGITPCQTQPPMFTL